MSADSSAERRAQKEILLNIRGLHIDGCSGGTWRPIIKDISLTLHRGEVLGLIGESGAGKSTLGLAAMGFARPGTRIAAGSILFDGLELTATSEKQRRRLRGIRIAYVAQSAAAAFNPAHRLIEQTVESRVLHRLTSRRTAMADAQDLYRRLLLPEPSAIGFRYPHQVSGGQLQRAMTAMAMSCRPDLIIFDEPTTALDVTTQVEVLAAIRGIVEQSHTAALYITHDLAVVAQMAHRIMVLRHGSFVEEASTAEMLKAPSQDYTRSLWAVRSLDKPERQSDDAILTLDGVIARYGRLNVLNDVTLSVPRGGTLAVVGESGSGKSTLARVITGLLQPAAGRISFDGSPLPARLNDRGRDLLRRIQMVHQSADTALNPRHKVREIVGRPLTFYHGIKGATCDRRIVELLDMIEMGSGYLDRLPSELSGGQKQRIAIARALAANPDLILCDEVTSACDQVVQEGILKLLLRLQRELGMSFLFITHDIATVRAIADEVVVMHQGRVVEQGAKHEVLTPPHPAYTRLLLSSVPEMDPEWLTKHLAERMERPP